MNSLDINRILARLESTRRFYLGCFASDQIPTNVSHHPSCMVVNIDASTGQGTHWVSIFSDHPSRVEYYDPLGLWPSPSAHIMDYLCKFSHIRFNTKPLQSALSRSCGRHAIFFLHHRCSGMSMEAIVRFFVSARRKPDSVVNEFAQKHIFGKQL
jgi:hypothetical protein